MVLVVNRASVVETTLDITFAVAELPTATIGAFTYTNRAVPTYTITTSGTASLGAETLPVTATPVDLDAGTPLNFSGVIATVGTYTAAGATSLAILPLPGAVGSGATAVTKAWRYVVGAFNATIKPDIKNVDVTNYLSGVGKEQVTTGNSKTFSLEFNSVLGDKGGEILRKIIYDKAFVGREFYSQLTFKTGEIHEGATLLLSASPTQAVQDKRSFQCEVQIQGSAYVYTPPLSITV